MRNVVMVIVVTHMIGSIAAAKSPHSGAPVKMPGLKAAAQIARDDNGIAHISANNEHDLFFLQGFVHAQDRLFQMDVSRRRASGTLAELLGPNALESDVELRTIGLRRAAARSMTAISERASADLEAYAAGVNAYVARHHLPLEYAILELTRFQPWTALDSLTVGKLIAFGLSFDMEDIERTTTLTAYQEAGAILGFDGTALFFQDLFRAAPFDPASTIPDASDVPGVVPPGAVASATSARTHSFDVRERIQPRVVELGKRYLEKTKRVPYLRRVLDRESPPGSNQWAVSGLHTASGLPLMANDPHLALDTPTTLYPIHLRGGGLDVIGSGFPGAPFVVVGHNRHIAWGATINPMDVTDVYQETVVPDPASPSGLSTLYLGRAEPVIAIPEVYRVNQIENGVLDDLVLVPPDGDIPPATLIVPRRNMGPIIDFDAATGLALSLQFTGFSATREVDAFLTWNGATGLDEFVRGLQFFDFGSQNFAYVDVKGNIAYFTSAEMPIREDLQAGGVKGLPPFFIRNGAGGNEWLPVQNPQPDQALPFEILPFDEMPQIVNPPAGWFVNANNDPVGVTLDNNPLNQLRPGGGIFYLNPGYRSIRAGRITQMIEEKLSHGGALSVEDLKAMQADVVLLDAQVFVPHVVQALENAHGDGAHPGLAVFSEDPRVAEAVDRLAAWDATAPTGIAEGYDASDESGELFEPSEAEIDSSVAATIYSAWRGQFIRNTIDATLAGLGLQAHAPNGNLALSALRNLLDNFDENQGVGASGVSFFNVPGVADADDRRDILILRSLADSLDLLSGEPFAAAFQGSTDQSDYRWGKLHRIVFEHPLDGPFSIPPAGGAFPAPLEGLPGIPTDGGFETVDASRHGARADAEEEFMFDRGPVTRFVAEADRAGGVHAEAIWPGGTSGVLGDPSYLNMLPLWLTNDTVPLLRRNDEVERNTETVTKFVPDRRGSN